MNPKNPANHQWIQLKEHIKPIKNQMGTKAETLNIYPY